MKKKMCFVVSSPYTAKAFLENHFEMFSNYVDVYLVANFEHTGTDVYSNHNLKGVQHIPIPRKINLIKDFSALLMLIKYFRRERFDVITTFTPKAGLLGILGARIAGIGIRIHFFTGQVWHTKDGLLKNILKFFDRVVVYYSTNILVDGKPQQEFLIENNILTKNNSLVLGKGTISGIDLSRFCPNFPIRKAIRSKLQIADSDVVFLFLGRLNFDKGIIELAEAFKKLSALFDNVKLLIVGPEEENIGVKVEEMLKDNDSYILYGPTSVPEDVIQACDVFCLPSHREAFGLSVIEASACEKPVICSDTYGLKDTMVDEITGLRHVTYDVNSIFDKMKQFVESNELRVIMGKNGRRYVVEHFDKKILAQLWLDYYKALLQL